MMCAARRQWKPLAEVHQEHRLPVGPVDRPRWSIPDKGGRQTCLACRGQGEMGGKDCGNCDGDGYRWEAT